MSDLKDPQDLGLEDQDNLERDIKDLKLLKIALTYLSNEIVVDTPTEGNGLTALELLIVEEFSIRYDEKFDCTLEGLKNDVISVLERKKKMQEEDSILGNRTVKKKIS